MCGVIMLEQKADEVTFSGMTTLLETEQNMTHFIKNKEILDMFERWMNETKASAENKDCRDKEA
jgi:hypothetical protein